MKLKRVSEYIYGNTYYTLTTLGNVVELKFISKCFDKAGEYYAFKLIGDRPKEFTVNYKHEILGNIIPSDTPFDYIGELDNYIPPIKNIIPNSPNIPGAGCDSPGREYTPLGY